jgi:hypothetical protein
MLPKIRETLVELTGDEELLFADGFDSAIIGVDVVTNRVVYSHGLMMEALVLEGMTAEDAMEHLDFNVLGAYVGERTPIYIYEYEHYRFD